MQEFKERKEGGVWTRPQEEKTLKRKGRKMDGEEIGKWVRENTDNEEFLQRIEAVGGDETWETIAEAGGITVEDLNKNFTDEQREFLWALFTQGLSKTIH